MHTGKHAAPRRTKRRPISRYTKAVIRWLIFCPPAGLLMMWSDRCRWARVLKSAISCVFAGVVVALCLPSTQPPPLPSSGVQLVSAKAMVEVQGPRQDVVDEGLYEVYIPTSIKPPSVIIEPTPSPEPVYVYCNTGGKNYHDRKCRYVKPTSARLTLSYALDHGFTQCKKCNAPAPTPG